MSEIFAPIKKAKYTFYIMLFAFNWKYITGHLIRKFKISEI